jgi:glutamate carboxypeptidase
MHRRLSLLRAETGRMVEMLGRFVRAESPTTDKAAVDRLGEIVGAALETAGARVRVIPIQGFGNHLLAEFGDPGPGGRMPVLALGHLDTVWERGTLGSMPFRVDDGRAYGPGSFDMKGGIVQLVFALGALRSEAEAPSPGSGEPRRSETCGGGPPPVVALLTSDEETGSPSSRPFIEEQARRARAVLVLEPSLPPDGKLKTFRKGVGVFHLRVTGRAAHAGLDPHKGISALQELALQIQRIHAMNDVERGTTLNVGVARGGTRVNVVAADAAAEIDLRVSSIADARRMEERLLGLAPFLAGAQVQVTGGIDRPPLERSPAVVALFERAHRLAAEVDWELGEGAAGGGSDGNLTAALGIPTLDGLGAVGDGAHAPSEHVLVEELPRRAALLASLFDSIPD